MRIGDADIERYVGRLLQWGVTLAGSTMLTGGILFLSRHAGEMPSYKTFHDVPVEFKTIPGIVHGLGSLSGRAVIQFGVLLMIATPVMRVAFAALAFAFEKDWLYTVISGIVLCLLLYALL